MALVTSTAEPVGARLAALYRRHWAELTVYIENYNLSIGARMRW
jgi:hypothetical protein